MIGSASSSHRPADRELVRSSLRAMGNRALVDILFGGVLDGSELLISDQIGGRTRSVLGQRVRLGDGLGGKAMLTGRPAGVDDYLRSTEITHVFDSVIRYEGLRTMSAVPIIVDGRPRGALYAATRGLYHLGDSIVGEVEGAARTIGFELKVRDEVDRRVAILRVAAERTGSGDPQLTELVRHNYAELVSIASLTDDTELAQRLRAFARRIGTASDEQGESQQPRLSRRQLDVLSQVALGCEYAEVGARLGLKTTTVRSYMRTIMEKLNASNRIEAVAVARRYRLLP